MNEANYEIVEETIEVRKGQPSQLVQTEAKQEVNKEASKASEGSQEG